MVVLHLWNHEQVNISVTYFLHLSKLWLLLERPQPWLNFLLKFDWKLDLIWLFPMAKYCFTQILLSICKKKKKMYFPFDQLFPMAESSRCNFGSRVGCSNAIWVGKKSKAPFGMGLGKDWSCILRGFFPLKFIFEFASELGPEMLVGLTYHFVFLSDLDLK